MMGDAKDFGEQFSNPIKFLRYLGPSIDTVEASFGSGVSFVSVVATCGMAFFSVSFSHLHYNVIWMAGNFGLKLQNSPK